MPASPYLGGAILRHLAGDTAYPMPDELYVALYTADPLTGGSEATGGGYARVAVALGDIDGNDATNATEVLSLDLPAGTYPYLGLCDAATAGNLLIAEPLTDADGNPAPQTVAAGDGLSFAPGTITLSVT
jgi:hypothetical protein